MIIKLVFFFVIWLFQWLGDIPYAHSNDLSFRQELGVLRDISYHCSITFCRERDRIYIFNGFECAFKNQKCVLHFQYVSMDDSKPPSTHHCTMHFQDKNELFKNDYEFLTNQAYIEIDKCLVDPTKKRDHDEFLEEEDFF